MQTLFQFPATNTPSYTCIWLHGLGASGQDMRMIAEAMRLDNLWVRHLFLDAPTRPVTINQGYVMPAWYDITGTTMTDREDVEGITASTRDIHALIEEAQRSGFRSDQILLAGFSQGAAMALYAALTYAEPLAGVAFLSGYLPLSNQIALKQSQSTPMFIGYGRYDAVVMPAWTQETVRFLKDHQYQGLTVSDYPIDHGVCPEEINALSAWMRGLKK